jgi:hypothetical protein
MLWIRIDFNRLDPDPGEQNITTNKEEASPAACTSFMVA